MRDVARNTFFAVASLLMTAGIVGFSDQAFATTDGAPEMTVRYDTATATTPQGRRALDHRIRLAAAHLCETGNGGAAIGEMQCRADSVARAEARLDDQLTMAVTPIEIAGR